MKNVFYFTLKALFVLEIFKFLFWFFSLLEKRLDRKVRWNLSMILKTNKKMYELMFFDIKKYVYSESVFNTCRKNTNFKKISFGQNKRYKKFPFFLWRTPAQHSFTCNLRFLYELKHKVRLSKTVCGIFHFRFRLLFIKVYIFCSTKFMDSDFKTSEFLSKLR